ncbi:VCBS repeat-containing protein [Halioglobus sp. HI00S01]|uniref:FG-GAP repeat domain-containing protein n=1 Tax=Halioglobus sp. HI00S01 TaxID=1822214 RepID=UPI0018D48E87|nr:VCBS repeat-containing protein [Halioglobus sp. HI00S01]
MIVLGLSLSVFTGCKIKMEAPEGGGVTTASGDYYCEAGKTCEVDIPDGEAWAGTFIAQPQPGYVFDSWQSGGACGGQSEPCSISLLGEHTAYDIEARLIPMFRKAAGGKHAVTLNPLPTSVLIDDGLFDIREIDHIAVEDNYSTIKYFGLGDTDADGNPEVFVSGWTDGGSYIDTNGEERPANARLQVFEAGPDATELLDANELLGRSTTDGTAFIRVHDFDRNGHDDLLIIGHNESPFVPTENILFLNDGNQLTPRSIEPAMAMHEGSLADINGDGYTDIIGSAYMSSYDWSDDPAAPFSYGDAVMILINDQNGGFKAWPLRFNVSIEGSADFQKIGGQWIHTGSAVAAANLDDDPEAELVIVDAYDGSNGDVSTSSYGSSSIIIDNIRFDSSRAYGDIKPLPIPYFHKQDRFKDSQSKFLSSEFGTGRAHDIQVDLFDMDNDGDQDILVSSMLWNDDYKESAGVLQFLQNKGNGRFSDITDKALYNYNLGNQGGHDNLLMDVNGDGFIDILAVDASTRVAEPHEWTGWIGEIYRVPDQAWANEVLINTGNGKFVSTLWEGFAELDQRTESILKSYGPTYEPYFLGGQKYFPYLLADGRLGFITYGVANEREFYFDVRANSRLHTGPNATDPSRHGAAGYNEYYYLTENPDVVALVKKGEFENGLEHYLEIGKAEGRRAFAEGAVVR